MDETTRSIADLVRPGELTVYWTITRINVPDEYRGKGHGSALLRRICGDADQEQVVVALEVMPSGPLSYDDLVAWYERYGFHNYRQTGYMVRRPT